MDPGRNGYIPLTLLQHKIYPSTIIYTTAIFSDWRDLSRQVRSRAGLVGWLVSS